MGSMSCASATACAVVGTYNDSSGGTVGLLLTGSRTSWDAMEALPADAVANPQAFLSSIVCATATPWVGAGGYVGSSNIKHGAAAADDRARLTPGSGGDAVSPW
jgi:hypothetical protein